MSGDFFGCQNNRTTPYSNTASDSFPLVVSNIVIISFLNTQKCTLCALRSQTQYDVHQILGSKIICNKVGNVWWAGYATYCETIFLLSDPDTAHDHCLFIKCTLSLSKTSQFLYLCSGLLYTKRYQTYLYMAICL